MLNGKRARTYGATVLTVWIMAAMPLYSEESGSSLPPMPKGYSSQNEVQAAILAGQVKLINAANVAVPEPITEMKGIEYGNVNGRALQLDLYLPKTAPKPAPCILFIHGGAWKGGHREDMKFYTVKFAAQGYVTATMSYRLSKEASFPAAVEDAKCAVRWLRAHAKEYGIDSNRIAVSGNSAGGHLSLMVGYSSDVPELEGNGGNPGVRRRVQGVVNFYGPTDMTTDFAKSQGVVKDFLEGKTYDEAPDLYKKASPIIYLTKDDPPTLILHGTIDSTVPIDQADMLEQKLKALGIPYLYDKFVGWPHAMDLAEAVNHRSSYQMEVFLAKYLKAPAK